jgi:3'(2'), 5'-bisphosphate nucleotidase
LTSFDLVATAALVDALTALAVSAAQAIRRWDPHTGVRIKADGSPVTAADEAAEAVIREGLSRLTLDVPVISEEQAETERPSIAGANFVLVDPLDGTREFIAGRGEYTVNIALVRDGIPILGVIAAPTLGLVWRGIVGHGAERLEFSGSKLTSPQPIHTRPRPTRELFVMTSRSHLDARTKTYLERWPQAERLACGSSVKFCRLAEGSADLYPRLAPTRDWDVAAGHAILVAAGGRVVTPDGTALVYGSPKLIIPGFIAWGDAEGRDA